MELSDLPLEILERIIQDPIEPKDYLSLASVSKSLNHVCSLVNIYVVTHYCNIRNVANKHPFKNLVLYTHFDNFPIEDISPVRFEVGTFDEPPFGVDYLEIPESVETLIACRTRLDLDPVRNTNIKTLSLMNVGVRGKIPKSVKSIATNMINPDFEDLENVESYDGYMYDGLDIEDLANRMPKLEHLSLKLMSWDYDQNTSVRVSIPNLPNLKSVTLDFPLCGTSYDLDFQNNKFLEKLRLNIHESKIEIINPPTKLEEYNVLFNVAVGEFPYVWHPSLNLSAKRVIVEGTEDLEYICDDNVQEIEAYGGAKVVLSNSVETCTIIYTGDVEVLDTKKLKKLDITADFLLIRLGKVRNVNIHAKIVEIIDSYPIVEELTINAEEITGDLIGFNMGRIVVNPDANIEQFFHNDHMI